ncbi:hypothetical protein WICMUC_002835 [Wickerhamomyces mucosus]|uniref:BZIP domain-containing protein n=1 Tax=Wickerhamomyces mucosus TaxID=1378264 RepID=A0A9P8PPX5_9ASCO|nr:hypothetical protein WICMUC_002835 [Wickerhamomyces mucosus]
MVDIDIPTNFKTSLPPRKRAKTKEEKEQRRVERILRNRKAAHASREKKRKHVEFLESYVLDLEKQLSLVSELNFKLIRETYNGEDSCINELIDEIEALPDLKQKKLEHNINLNKNHEEDDDEEEEEEEEIEDVEEVNSTTKGIEVTCLKSEPRDDFKQPSTKKFKSNKGKKKMDSSSTTKTFPRTPESFSSLDLNSPPKDFAVPELDTSSVSGSFSDVSSQHDFNDSPFSSPGTVNKFSLNFNTGEDESMNGDIFSLVQIKEEPLSNFDHLNQSSNPSSNVNVNIDEKFSSNNKNSNRNSYNTNQLWIGGTNAFDNDFGFDELRNPEVITADRYIQQSIFSFHSRKLLFLIQDDLYHVLFFLYFR